MAWRIFTVLLAGIGNHAWAAMPVQNGPIDHIPLPFPASDFIVHPSGELIVAWNGGRMLEPEKLRSAKGRRNPNTQQSSQVAVIDVASGKVIVKRTLQVSIASAAITGEHLVLQPFRDPFNQLEVLRLRELKPVKTILTTSRVTRLLATEDLLIVATSGALEVYGMQDFTMKRQLKGFGWEGQWENWEPEAMISNDGLYLGGGLFEPDLRPGLVIGTSPTLTFPEVPGPRSAQKRSLPSYIPQDRWARKQRSPFVTRVGGNKKFTLSRDKIVVGEQPATPVTAEFVPRQSSVTLSTGKQTVLKHNIRGMRQPVTYSLATELSGMNIAADTGTVTLDNAQITQHAIETVQRFIQSRTRLGSSSTGLKALRELAVPTRIIAGRFLPQQPTGFPVALIVRVQARTQDGRTAALTYCVLIELPMEPLVQFATEAIGKLARTAPTDAEGARKLESNFFEVQQLFRQANMRLQALKKRLGN